MDDLRSAIAAALALTPASRLVAIDAAGLVDGDALAVYAAVARAPGGGPRTVVADSLRLPFVAALADLVLLRTDRLDAAGLREIWRILAPAGVLVVVVPAPASHSLASVVGRRLVARRAARRLAAALFDPGQRRAVAGAVVIRATKRDGLAPPQAVRAAVQAPAVA